VLVSFLYPFPLRGADAPFLWVYYHQLSKLKPDQVCFILDHSYLQPLEYFEEKGRWEMQNEFVTKETHSKINQYGNHLLPQARLSEIYAETNHDLTFFRNYLSFPIPKLQALIYEKLKIISSITKIDAVMSWSNCPSLQYACDALGIRVIYNELGPLRSSNFLPTGCFDFSGVNGHTSAVTRFVRFVDQYKRGFIELSSREAILAKFADKLGTVKKITPRYEYGLALQVENDSNVIAYSNGFDNVKLINEIKKKSNSILIRKHPGSSIDYSVYGELDRSPTSIEFILNCKKIASVNSGTIMEALLFDKKVELFGDCPYKIIYMGEKFPEFSEKEFKKLVLNFLVFNYFMSFRFLFDMDYISFRLLDPDEWQVNLFHKFIWNELAKGNFLKNCLKEYGKIFLNS